MSKPVLRIALAVPLRKFFDYLPPRDGSVCRPGQRVLVPFGRGSRIGVVVECADYSELPEERLRPVRAVLDEGPLLDQAHLDFLCWAASYYHHPVGEVVCAALPLRLRRERQALDPRQWVWRLAVDGARARELTARAPRQRALIEMLLKSPRGALSREVLASLDGDVSGALRALASKGVVARETLEVAAGSPAEVSVPELHSEQRTAVEAVAGALGRFAPFLLEGVTGSGKTEVYLRLAQRVLARGESVMVLIPEISLTPQLRARFAERFGPQVALLHSALSGGERERAWQRVRQGEARVVLGTRSCVLYPVDRLGLVIVDEEHDSSFKQQEGFRYSARDLAVIRAQRAACPVVLGSATPSLESLHNAHCGRYHWLHLRQRAGGARAPRVELLDIRDQPLQSGLSQPLLHALEQTLAQGEQGMVFMNRRGYAPVLACHACGWVSDCPRCDARQTVHRRAGLLWCHHCGSQRPVPRRCPACGSAELYPLGQGTEQLEQRLAERFPEVPLIRIDRDATARKGSLARLLAQVHQAGSALLVGTQMLAKGHHFPRVTLVGVVDADGGLFSADFRAPERLAQLLIQVAGRAGRGARLGRVLIQTRYPDHPLMQTLAREGYDAFAGMALRERQEAGYPPFSHQALLRAEGGDAERPLALLQALVEALGDTGEVSLWGPVPAPMARRVGRYRVHLLLQAAVRAALHPVLERVVDLLPGLPGARSVRWSLDVDPLDSY